jgi:hypothetical protein
MVPKAQVFIDQKDIFLNHGVAPALIIAEEGVLAQFTVDNASAWINSALFKVGMALKIKMGYADVLEIVFEGKIRAIKNIFPSNGPPQILVFGKETTAKSVTADTVVPLFYGDTLNSFTLTIDEDIKNGKCMTECIGLPDIKAGVIVAVAGLGSQFNQRYLVEKAVHTFDSIHGFKTQFEAKSIDPPKRVDLGSYNLLKRR